MSHELPLIFACEGDRLVGIASLPAQPSSVGVVIVVGGPQYRAGSHRQFTLLARHLATEGIASLRFDYRGMGDSEGEPRNFERVEPDIRAAIDTLLQHAPNLSRIVLWGLCDAASAALMYAHSDPRVAGLVLLNPWVHSEAGAARVKLKHYYLSRLRQRSFWSGLFSGNFNPLNSLHGALALIRSAFGQRPVADPPMNFVERMRLGFERYPGPILLILSGQDFTAQEFIALCDHSPAWTALSTQPRVQRHRLETANHTFSNDRWRQEVAILTSRWLQELARHPLT